MIGVFQAFLDGISCISIYFIIFHLCGSLGTEAERAASHQVVPESSRDLEDCAILPVPRCDEDQGLVHRDARLYMLCGIVSGVKTGLKRSEEWSTHGEKKMKKKRKEAVFLEKSREISRNL